MRSIRRAMILGAGLGTRMLPITKIIPKPLIPILNVPNLIYSLSMLKHANITDVVINLFHLGELIPNYISKDNYMGMNIIYSLEPILLGTGGGLKKASSFFKNEPFVLVNCDCVTNVDLLPHIDQHFNHQALATMLLFENPKNQSKYSVVGIDSNSLLTDLPGYQRGKAIRRGIFTGIHILDARTLDYLDELPSDIITKLYHPLLIEEPDKVRGDFINPANWYDCGDLSEFWRSSMELLTQFRNFTAYCSINYKNKFVEAMPSIWIDSKDKLDPSINYNPPVMIGANVKIKKNVIIGPNVIIGDGARITSSCIIENAVILPNSTIDSNRPINNSVIFANSMIKIE